MANEFITDIIDPPDLIGYVRENAVLDPTNDNLAGILPPVDVGDIEYELQNISGPSLQVARYRAWDAAPPLGSRQGYAVVRGEIAPLGLSMRLNEREAARVQQLRAAAAAGSRDANSPRVAQIYDDALTCAMAAQLRIEVARADLMHDGIVTINENGAIVTADYGVPGTHLVTAGTAWSDHTNSVPITNLQTWEALYKADNGGRYPDGWLISTTALADLAQNAQLKQQLLGTSGGFAPPFLSNDTIATLIRLAGVRAPLIPFDGYVPDASGNATPTLPVRDVVAFRRGMGSVFYGPTPTAQVMAGNGIIRMEEAPGIIAWAETQIRPAAVITTGEAVALPVLRDPNALFRAIV